MILNTKAVAVGVLAASVGMALTYYKVRASTAPKGYNPTEVQSLRLQVDQKDALLYKTNLEQAQRLFQDKLNKLTEDAKVVIRENKWPADTQFNPNDLSFSAPAPAPKPEVKK